MREQWERPPMRIGHGYDVHRLTEGRELILGGVKIPYEKGLLGHSDADVLLHAAMDAVLGALALGDIGHHFPDSDEAYRGASSVALAKKVAQLADEAGYRILNLDMTLIAQRPKIASFLADMRRSVADSFSLPLSAVSIKATTEEGLGFTGTGEGMAAHAVCLCMLK